MNTTTKSAVPKTHCSLPKRQYSLLGAIFIGTLLGVAFFPSAHAQTVYWDGNGTQSGFQAADGDFGTSTFWNPNSNGVGTLATWSGGNATFNGNNTSAITINNAASATNVYLDNAPADGTVTTVNLSGSNTLTVSTNFAVGQGTNANASTATAILNQSGGTIAGTSTLSVGRNGSNGTWTMSGGSATGTALWVGLDVRGGVSGAGTVAPIGTMTISGGNMTINGNVLLGRGAVGYTASSTLNMNSGSLTASTLFVGLGNYTNSTVNLNGGTLTASNVQMSGTTGATSTFRFNGGTLKSGANSVTFMTGLTNAYVDSGGALIDINGKTSTIAQTLLQGTGTGGLTLSSSAGGGNLTLSGANTFAGATTISGGILVLGNSLALQNSALDTAASVAGNSTSGLKTTVTTLTLGGLSGNKDLASVFTTTSGGYSGVTALTLNPGTGVTNTYSGNITNGAAGMTLTKTGAGTQILSGNNTYGGQTIVTTGTLVVDAAGVIGNGGVSVTGGEFKVNGTIGNGAVSVSNGAVLSGTGTILGETTISGTHNPGNSPGLQTFTSNLSYTGTSSFNFELAANTVAGRGTSYDGVNVGNNLSITGNPSLNLIFNAAGSGVTFSDTFWNSDQTWNIFAVTGTTTGAFNLGSISVDSLGAAYTALHPSGSFNLQQVGNNVNLNWVAVPEPSAWILAAFGLTTAIVFRRRRTV